MVACRPLRSHLATGRLLLFLAASASMSCSPEANPFTPGAHRPGDGFLTIQTEKREYTWAEVSLANEGSFRATVSNHAGRPVHATLGDAFNAAAEQKTLYLAEGSNGFLEQWVPPSAWRSLPRPFLDEGVGTVVIRPDADYILLGHVVGAKTTGRFRLRVQYFDGTEARPGEATHQDYSNVFTIK